MEIDKFFLDTSNSALLLIDIQEKFLPHIHNNEGIIEGQIYGPYCTADNHIRYRE